MKLPKKLIEGFSLARRRNSKNCKRCGDIVYWEDRGKGLRPYNPNLTMHMCKTGLKVTINGIDSTKYTHFLVTHDYYRVSKDKFESKIICGLGMHKHKVATNIDNVTCPTCLKKIKRERHEMYYL